MSELGESVLLADAPAMQVAAPKRAATPVRASTPPRATTPTRANAQNDDDDVVVGRGLNGRWEKVKEDIVEGALDVDPAEFTERGEVVGDPTMHPEVKVSLMFAQDSGSPAHAILQRESSAQTSGILRLKAARSFFFTTAWRENYVHIDPREGIRFSKNLDSFQDGKFERTLGFSDIRSVEIVRSQDSVQMSLSGCLFTVNLVPGAPGHKTFGARLMLRAESEAEAEMWVSELQSKLLIAANVYTVGLNGEFPENTRGVKPGVAVCFSGGALRALAAR
jgi:hypothetical protein